MDKTEDHYFFEDDSMFAIKLENEFENLEKDLVFHYSPNRKEFEKEKIPMEKC